MNKKENIKLTSEIIKDFKYGSYKNSLNGISLRSLILDEQKSYDLRHKITDKFVLGTDFKFTLSDEASNNGKPSFVLSDSFSSNSFEEFDYVFDKNFAVYCQFNTKEDLLRSKQFLEDNYDHLKVVAEYIKENNIKFNKYDITDVTGKYILSVSESEMNLFLNFNFLFNFMNINYSFNQSRLDNNIITDFGKMFVETQSKDLRNALVNDLNYYFCDNIMFKDDVNVRYLGK